MSRDTQVDTPRETTGTIRGLDHVLVGVHDLEATRRTWTRLGFTACPRGKHIGWGTANYCLMFPQDYVELIGIVDASQFTNRLDDFLAEREGLMAVAFATDDAERCAETLRAGGLAIEGPKDLKRIIELPEGDALPEFRLVFPPPEATPDLRSFVVTHLSRDLVWRPEWLEHANGARGVVEVIAAVDLPGALGQAYSRIVGPDAVSAADGWLQVIAGDCRLTFLGPAPLAARYPKASAHPLPWLVGFGVEVGDLAATAAFLKSAEIAFSEGDDGRLVVDPQEANGVTLEFVAVA
ncbi:VOC family protein [Algihabitans albus]|uniref:VOC family protein n=1 Tax=Algihabitans albus TaxID=2164067 RepID=UPI000E5D80BC|nr:VOC family protein [Algihabitans albus]